MLHSCSQASQVIEALEMILACETVHVGDPGDKQEWYGAIGKDKGDLAGTCTQGQSRAGESRRGFENIQGEWYTVVV
jgi:hypothetical protein